MDACLHRYSSLSFWLEGRPRIKALGAELTGRQDTVRPDRPGDAAGEAALAAGSPSPDNGLLVTEIDRQQVTADPGGGAA